MRHSPIPEAQPALAPRREGLVWLFDLDNTLHDASSASLGQITEAMTRYMVEQLELSRERADELRRGYWLRYGATLLGLVRHHGVKAAHFLHHTHLLPGLEGRLQAHRHDRFALAKLPGRRYVLTNAPRGYALRVLDELDLRRFFDGVFTIEDMAMFGQLRPKPDARMLRRLAARLGVPPASCVLVEDTLEHQKAARRVGMKTVWLRRWIGGAGGRPARRPAYVDRRVSSVSALLRRPHRGVVGQCLPAAGPAWTLCQNGSPTTTAPSCSARRDVRDASRTRRRRARCPDRCSARRAGAQAPSPG